MLLTAGALAAVATLARRRYARYAVEGQSMEPALRPGDWIIVDRAAYRVRLPRPGHVVLALDPREPAREIVKRVIRVDLHGQAWLEGDNGAGSTDSRNYGPVPRELVLGRVGWRYWPRVGRVR